MGIGNGKGKEPPKTNETNEADMTSGPVVREFVQQQGANPTTKHVPFEPYRVKTKE